MKVRPFSEVAHLMGGRQGWHRGEGDVIFEHPKLGRLIHVAICNDNGTPMWDQPLHVEPIGAVTVPENKRGELGLIQVERPTVKSPDLYRFPELDLASLGVASTETPRGFPRKGEEAVQTVVREAGEELQSPILDVVLIGRYTPNTTFYPHRIPVYRILVDSDFAGTVPPDVNEKILKVEWVSEGEFLDRVKRGEIHCGMTLAAYTLFAVSRGLRPRVGG